MVTDPIADMLTRIRNATTVRHDRVMVPASKMKIELARILKEEGFIVNYDVLKSGTPQAVINIYLHYRSQDEPAIGPESHGGPTELRRTGHVAHQGSLYDERSS